MQYAKLYRLALAWSQQQSLAQDLVQEAMLKAIEKQHQLQNLQDLEPWLCKILHNLYIDRLRYNQQWQFTDTEDIDHFDFAKSCEDNCITQQTEFTVHQAIGCLPFEQREVVTLVDLQGFSYQETASVLEVPVGTVMSRLSRARSKLKSLLEREYSHKKSQKVVYLRSQK
ncbi:RNA polymerase sigma factor [Thiosulfativibrio zosterae]|uniref:RNA polymerase sigma factor n=1 Tax=Thiosulfativibrio zosterae TaxID=2675053 RepID=A0A6F8PQM1_9GAMM|nr:DNA-directed RNA polymerase sigma-70 factor [Thiosulfativibrio zosterae]